MSTLAERLQLALDRMPGVRKADLARACGVAGPSVSLWLSGKTHSLAPESSRRAAQFLRCRREWLETGIGSPGWTDEQHASQGAATALVAQETSHPVSYL